jgi:hypothetical protein
MIHPKQPFSDGLGGCRRILCGEVLDIDAITGGFNLQAAWTTGYVVGQHIGE